MSFLKRYPFSGVLPVILISFLVILAAAPPADAQKRQPPYQLDDVIEVAKVWSGHPVGFDLLTTDQQQYVAYYDDQRRMTVASRELDSKKWTYQVLDSKIGWDSHNYITMALDDAGNLHLAGNMHVVPLIYFRTREPGDITTFQRIEKMVGRDEDRCTYPRFFTGADGALIFAYRDGGSGNGRRFFNIYDTATRTWQRLLEKPLLDGTAQSMNAYPSGPTKGPDGYFHLVWMWRDTPDCRTNHHISYIRSKDLKQWENAAGEPQTLPITPENQAVVIDPTGPNMGMINMGYGLGFDRQKRPIANYHKYDPDGNSQIFNARFEKDEWKIYQTSDWDWRWEFGGGGSVPCLVRSGAVKPGPDNTLVQTYSHKQQGSGGWKLDPESLKPIGKYSPPPTWPGGLNKVESDHPGMQARWAGDSGRTPEPGIAYRLRWETQPSNRDKPHAGPIPDPVPLKLYRFKSRTASSDEIASKADQE